MDSLPLSLTLAPALAQRRYAQMAHRALWQPSPAIKLFCIECMGYSYPDAKGCENERCPLWAVSRRLFRVSEGAENALESEIEGELPAIDAGVV